MAGRIPGSADGARCKGPRIGVRVCLGKAASARWCFAEEVGCLPLEPGRRKGNQMVAIVEYRGGGNP
jgi:hypothetical protein